MNFDETKERPITMNPTHPPAPRPALDGKGPDTGRLAMSRRTALRSALILLGGSALALTGCSTRDTHAADAAPGTADAPATGKGPTITDQKGRTISFDAPVERIATTVIPAPSMIIAADQRISKIVAVNRASQMQAKNGLLAEMFPEIMDLPIAAAGNDFVPNIETIAAQNPDVVIQWAHMGDEIITPIEQAGLELLLIIYGTQEDLEYWVEMFTELVGKPERGEKILADMHRDRAAVEEAVGTAHRRPRAVNLFNYDEMQVSGTESYMDFWLTLCGADNVGTKAGPGSSVKVSREELLAWDPEVVFIGNFSPATPEDMYDDPFFAEMPAVKNKRVYKIPNGGFAWDPPSNESNLMWQWAAQLLHPETADFDLRRAMKDSYSFLYDHKLTDEQIDRVLAIDANSGSANYDAFTR